ncbi:MAG: Adaptive-response sensory-kinase SasA [Bacteroidota bacterium]|jgi:PAS domain S-box-containing protein
MNTPKQTHLAQRFSSWFSQKPRLAGVLAFLFLMPFVYFAISLRYKIIRENEHREMSNILNVVQRNMAQIYKNSYTTTLTLALTINDKGEPEDFEKVGKQLVESNPSIDAVQLVPNGVIKYIYPEKGNEAAMNYDIMHSNTTNQEALLALNTKSFYFAGPLTLKQGGVGVVGRLPVFKKNKFWGFSAVVIRMSTLLKASGIGSIDDSKYYFQFSKTDTKTGKETFYLKEKANFSDKYYRSVTIPEGNWNLYLISRHSDNAIYQIYTSLILGTLLCLIFGLWVYSMMKKPAEQHILILEQAKILVENEIKFKTLFEQAPVGIAKADVTSGTFLESNAQFSKITEFSQDELKNSSLDQLLSPEDYTVFQNALQQLKSRKQEEFNTEIQIQAKSGKRIWINLLVAPLWSNETEAQKYILIIEDIDTKKTTEEDLRNSFDLVNEQNKRLLNFSYIVSHNLRSHSSNIKSISNLMDEADTEEEKVELMEMLRKVSFSLQDTMTNLNEVVNIQSNIGLHREDLNLKVYIDSTLHVLNEQINQKDATLFVDVDSNATVVYNAAYLESILLNLVSNAIKYAAKDRVPIVKIEYNPMLKKLSVSDNGIGIDLKKHGHNMFGMYKTFHKNADAKGLGLFITKNQIEAMGGKITVESEPHKGTTFTVYFA